MKQTLFLIWFPKFKSILAENLTDEEREKIVAIRSTMSSGNYAGYSPVEQAKLVEVRKIIGSKEVFPVEI